MKSQLWETKSKLWEIKLQLQVTEVKITRNKDSCEKKKLRLARNKLLVRKHLQLRLAKNKRLERNNNAIKTCEKQATYEKLICSCSCKLRVTKLQLQDIYPLLPEIKQIKQKSQLWETKMWI